MARGRYSSSSRIFERRGDPWLSDRERVKDFQREPETENPDYDFDHRFHYSRNAKGKPKTVEPQKEVKTVRREPQTEADFARRGANILRKLHASNSAVRVEARETVQRFKPCPGCRKALCAARMRCAFPLGRKD